jgi:thiol-disulfide isomerase/thioredoxin
MPSLDGATAWLNSSPLTTEQLRGRVVVVDFWTYTCINWLRTLPYVRAWAQAYEADGLVVIGVHTPEFGIEHDVDSVRRAAKEMRLEYPIAVDNDYAVWEAFANHYWPALYFVDANGEIRHHHFGEGEYEQSEQVIQQLLDDAGAKGARDHHAVPDAQGIEIEADWDNLGSPETYVGYGRGEQFASPGGVAYDEHHLYAMPTQLRRNQWALRGVWTIGQEQAESHEPNAAIRYRFHARDAHLILGTAAAGTPGRFRVRIDGERPGDAHGIDVDADGNGTIVEPRLYQLIRQPGRVTDRELEIEFLDVGAQAFCFTFG